MSAPVEALASPKLRSQLADALLEYFQAVIDALDVPEKLPAYLAGRKPSELFVSPDVLKKERKAAPPDSRLSSPDEGDGDDGRPSSRGRSVREQFAVEAQDIGEDALYGLRNDETEKRVAWAEEQNALAREPKSRAVILAPPGQGKSFLAQMTAREFATNAWQALATQTQGVGDLPHKR